MGRDNNRDSLKQMDFQKIARTILPESAEALLHRAKLKFERRRLAAHPPLTEEDFTDILVNSLGLRPGDVVYVHSASDRLNLAFPFYRILFLIQETIGPSGTMLFPTYPNHRISSYEYLQQGNVFDVRKSPSYTGILTEFARRQRTAVRSLHPTKSVCAIGKVAKEITATHHLSPYPHDTGSPYYKLIEHDGKIIGIGASSHYLTFGHCVDDALKEKFPVRVYHDEIFDAPCINYDGKHVIVRTYAHDMSRVIPGNVPRFLKTHVSTQACQDLTVKGMKFFRANAPQLFEEIMELAKRGITAYPRAVYRTDFGRDNTQ